VPAGATAAGSDPGFPGSRVHVSVSGPTQAGEVLSIRAAGRNLARVHDGRPIAYGLELIVTDPAILPGPCLSTEAAELTRIASVPGGGSLLTYGDLDEGAAGPFVIREPYEPIGSGPLEICAYSRWQTDDAAWGQANVTIRPAPRARPRSLARPVVHRTGEVLTCSRGRWTNSPATFGYRWRIGSGREGPERSGARWRIPRAARGHRVQCAVTASNVKGSGHARSRAFRVPGSPAAASERSSSSTGW
jgi:hypothetical protein